MGWTIAFWILFFATLVTAFYAVRKGKSWVAKKSNIIFSVFGIAATIFTGLQSQKAQIVSITNTVNQSISNAESNVSEQITSVENNIDTKIENNLNNPIINNFNAPVDKVLNVQAPSDTPYTGVVETTFVSSENEIFTFNGSTSSNAQNEQPDPDDVITMKIGEEPGEKAVDYVTSHSVEAIKKENIFTVFIKARLAGNASDRKHSLKAEFGDEVELMVHFENSMEIEQVADNVIVSVSLPDHLEYINGSTQLFNTNHPNGATAKSDSLITDHGINIGKYSPYGDAYVIFRVKVLGSDKLEEGTTALRTWAKVTCNGEALLSRCDVIVEK